MHRLHIDIDPSLFKKHIEERKKVFFDVYASAIKAHIEFSDGEEGSTLGFIYYDAFVNGEDSFIEFMRTQHEFRGIKSYFDIDVTGEDPFFLRPFIVKDEFVSNKEAFLENLHNAFIYYQRAITFFNFTNSVYIVNDSINQESHIKGTDLNHEKIAGFMAGISDSTKLISEIKKAFGFNQAIPLSFEYNSIKQNIEAVIEISPMIVSKEHEQGYITSMISFKGLNEAYVRDETYLRSIYKSLVKMFAEVSNGELNIFKVKDSKDLYNELMPNYESLKDVQLNFALALKEFKAQKGNTFSLTSPMYNFTYSTKVDVLSLGESSATNEKMFLNMKNFNPDLVLILNALIYLYKVKPKDSEGFITFNIDEILELFEYKKKKSGGYEGGYPDKKRQEIKDYIETLKTLEMSNKDLNLQTSKGNINYIKSSLVVVSDIGNTNLNYYEYRLIIGDVLRASLKYEDEFTLMDGFLMKSKSNYQKFLGLYITLLWKNGKYKHITTVNNLLKYTVEVNLKNPAHEFKRFEDALVLFEQNNIINYASFSFDLEKYKTSTGDLKHGWFEDFLKTTITLHRPKNIKRVKQTEEIKRITSLSSL